MTDTERRAWVDGRVGTLHDVEGADNVLSFRPDPAATALHRAMTDAGPLHTETMTSLPVRTRLPDSRNEVTATPTFTLVPGEKPEAVALHDPLDATLHVSRHSAEHRQDCNACRRDADGADIGVVWRDAISHGDGTNR